MYYNYIPFQAALRAGLFLASLFLSALWLPSSLSSPFLASGALRAPNPPRPPPPTQLPVNFIAQLYSVWPNRGGRVRTVTPNWESIASTLTDNAELQLLFFFLEARSATK